MFALSPLYCPGEIACTYVPPVTVSVVVRIVGCVSGPNSTTPPLIGWSPASAGPVKLFPPSSLTHSSTVLDWSDPSGFR